MEQYIRRASPGAAEVVSVVDAIAGKYHPQRIYLYNQRFSATGATSGFKLCVVGDFADKCEAERDMYLSIDSEVPYDLLLYTPGEWLRLCDSVDSFARKIHQTGQVVYEQA